MTTRTTLAALLALALAGPVHQAQAFKCMPIYGNWCGIDWPAAGAVPPPVDAFDAACMRHDVCTAGPGPDTPCDIAFVNELHGLALVHGYLPRPLQWAEYVIRVKVGGPTMSGMPMPMPWDAIGLMSSLAAPCW